MVYIDDSGSQLTKSREKLCSKLLIRERQTFAQVSNAVCRFIIDGCKYKQRTDFSHEERLKLSISCDTTIRSLHK